MKHIAWPSFYADVYASSSKEKSRLRTSTNYIDYMVFVFQFKCSVLALLAFYILGNFHKFTSTVILS